MKTLQQSIEATVSEINRLRMANYDTSVLEIHLQSLLRQKAMLEIKVRQGKK